MIKEYGHNTQTCNQVQYQKQKSHLLKKLEVYHVSQTSKTVPSSCAEDTIRNQSKFIVLPAIAGPQQANSTKKDMEAMDAL